MIIEKIKNDELLRGSIILFIMMGFFNLLNYIFQISVARFLGSIDYGVFAVLMSFVYIFGIPSEAIQTIISKYTSKFNIGKDFGKMKDLIYRSMKKCLILASVLYLIFLIIGYLLSSPLKINFWLIALTGLFIFYVFSVPILRGVIQGRKKFFGLGLNLVLESFIKVILTIIFILTGLKVYGAIGGLLVAGVIGSLLAFLVIKEVFSARREKESLGEVYLANMPLLMAISSIVLIYSLDIILAKIFFSPYIAGQYAFISLIGKTILFVSMAIGKAMFPISSEKFINGKETGKEFKKSILIVAGISILAVILCLIMPELVIKIVSLGSNQYLEAKNILFIIAVAYSFIAISNIIVTYNLAINNMKKSAYFMIFFVVLQAIALILFHSSLIEFSVAVLIVNFLMFLYSLILIKKYRSLKTSVSINFNQTKI